MCYIMIIVSMIYQTPAMSWDPSLVLSHKFWNGAERQAIRVPVFLLTTGTLREGECLARGRAGRC